MIGPVKTSPDKLNDIFLDGIDSKYRLEVAESSISDAGRGLFVLEEISAGRELLRVAAPVVAAV